MSNTTEQSQEIKPNIFDYATSELSQDAFICWLLEWANPRYKNPELNKCALELIENLYGKIEVKTIVVKKQQSYRVGKDKNTKVIVDIQCVINDEVAIIIEDKVNANINKNQKKIYRDIVVKISNGEEITPELIYFKTGFQLKFEKEEEAGFKPFNRKNFLDILEKYQSNIDNNIFLDYYQYLNDIQKQCDAYKKTDLKKWGKYQWQGFLMDLHNNYEFQGNCDGNGNGKYIHNPQGGFYGYWWLWDKELPYLQIEKNKICIKINASERGDKAKYRECVFHKFNKNIDSFDYSNKKKFDKKKVMTLLKSKDFIVTKKDLVDMDKDLINMDETVKRLNEITENFENKLKENCKDGRWLS